MHGNSFVNGTWFRTEIGEHKLFTLIKLCSIRKANVHQKCPTTHRITPKDLCKVYFYYIHGNALVNGTWFRTEIGG